MFVGQTFLSAGSGDFPIAPKQKHGMGTSPGRIGTGSKALPYAQVQDANACAKKRKGLSMNRPPRPLPGSGSGSGANRLKIVD